MHQLQIESPAPDFELFNTQNQNVRLSDYRGRNWVFLVLNRGFMCPFCQRHMAQLHRDYPQFAERKIEIIIIGPDGPDAFKRYWQQENMPAVGLSDKKSNIANQFFQEVNPLKLGRMPAQFIIDIHSILRYQHYGASMRDIPENKVILNLFDRLQNSMR